MSLQEFFNSLKIRVKLLLAFGSILLLSLIIALIAGQTYSRIGMYRDMVESVNTLTVEMLQMDVDARYFMYEGFKNEAFHSTNRSPYIDQYQASIESIKKSLQNSSGAFVSFTQDSISTAILLGITDLDQQFNELVQLLKQRGFKDYGLEGELREAIHKVENSATSYDRIDMLMLRRHEKDFFLRKDLKYPKEFNNKITELIKKVTIGTSSIDAKSAILSNLLLYQRKFNDIVEVEQKIGLKDTDGLKGSINHNLITTKALVKKLEGKIKKESERNISKAVSIIILLLASQFVVGLLLATFYANALTNAIKQIYFAIRQLSEGTFPKKLVSRSNDEIGKAKTALNQLIERIQAAATFSELLGSGQLNEVYDRSLNNDVLAQSLIHMQTKLQQVNHEQHKINWTNHGLAQFNDVLKIVSDDLKQIGDETLKFVIQYVNLNQGVLFAIQKDPYGTRLKSISTFAYGKKKFLEQQIELGEGLAGQCALEKNIIVLKDLPHDYVKITSGLGEALPTYAIILPLVSNEELMGVLELSGFKELEFYQQVFLEKVASNVASMLLAKRSNAETKVLLQEAREKTEQLLAQEEEMRQNTEEMQALQEQLERRAKELEREVHELTLRLHETDRKEISKTIASLELQSQN